jgi:hypothetical protein
MTINSLSSVQSTPVAGLGTQTYNVITAGLYTCAVNFTIPYQASGSSNNSTVTTGGSSLQILVKQNATTKLTLANPAPTQPSMGGSVVMDCAVNDVITVVLSSAADADNALNAIKGIVNIYQGQ